MTKKIWSEFASTLILASSRRQFFSAPFFCVAFDRVFKMSSVSCWPYVTYLPCLKFGQVLLYPNIIAMESTLVSMEVANASLNNKIFPLYQLSQVGYLLGFFQCSRTSELTGSVSESFTQRRASLTRLVPLKQLSKQNKKLQGSARDRTRTCCVKGTSLTSKPQWLTYEKAQIQHL